MEGAVCTVSGEILEVPISRVKYGVVHVGEFQVY